MTETLNHDVPFLLLLSVWFKRRRSGRGLSYLHNSPVSPQQLRRLTYLSILLCVSLSDDLPTVPEGACCDGRVIKGNATDCTLSLTTAWVQIPAWAYEKVASDLGLGGGFRRVLRFPPLLTTS